MPENIESASLLAMTARWTAAVRAQESARADRLFTDPWATALAGEAGAASALTRKWIEMQASLGAPWIGTMDDPEEFLSARGWQATLTQGRCS